MTATPSVKPALKLAYGIGSTGEALVATTTTTFLLLFYNQVRGLPVGYVGTALAIGLIVNAVFDPLVGSWSDRTRSRWGRRHPFMFAAILPAGMLYFALFNPPDWGMWGQLAWLAITNTVLQQAMTLYHTPHLALGGELSNDYLERSSVMGYNTVCLWLGDTLGWVLSFRLFFRSSPHFPNGALDPTRWLPFSVVFGLTISTVFAFSSWSTRGRIPFLPQPASDVARFGLSEWARDIGRALANRNYVVLLLGLFFQSLMVGIRTGLWLYTATYFWRLDNDQISLFVIASFIGYAFAALGVKRLHALIDKRLSGALAILLYSAGPAVPLVLALCGILGPSTPGIMGLLIGFQVLPHLSYSVMTTTVYSLLADIADENELKFGVRQEGILYSTRTFFGRVDQALGTALSGWLLGLIAFPAKAVPGHVSGSVLHGLLLATVLSTIPGLMAAACYLAIRINRASFAATRRALDRRTQILPDIQVPSIPAEAV